VSKVLDMYIGSIDELGAFVPQYWSIPKRGPDSTWSIPKRGPDSIDEKFIPEKLNGSDCVNDVSYKFEGDDDDLRNCVIGESGVGGCVNPLCDMVGLWKDGNCGILNFEGVVWRCGFVTSVGCRDPMNADVFTGLVTAVELVSVVGCVYATCGLGTVTAVELVPVVGGAVSRLGVITAWFFVASPSEIDSWAQSDARLCRSSMASTAISLCT
jgi:hypothetical protein